LRPTFGGEFLLFLQENALEHSQSGSRRVLAVICGLWLLFGLALLCAGPILNSHEAIVAQIARQTLQDGEWIVPHYLELPFLLKPPLTPWLAAIAGWIGPADGVTGLPVSTATARLPSLLATLATVLLLYSLASSMHGRSIGLCTAFIYATSAGVMAFALNATSEALLATFCAWAYAEFWWSREAVGRRKTLHQVLFYVAFGLAMMAKAPMPLVVVALPLAAWWWTERSLTRLADGGLRAAPRAAKTLGRDILGQFRAGLTDLGLWWGLPIAFGFLLAWMWAVSREVPYIWELWDAEYLHRLEDREIWPATHGFWYYLPILVGLTAPWLLSMPEALAGPFLRRYSERRRPMLYAWYWVVVTTLVLSCMHFKQDYYLIPVLPGCALLLGPVLHKLFFEPSAPLSRTMVRAILGGVVFVLVATPIICWLTFGDEIASKKVSTLAVLGLGVPFGGGILLATVLFLRGRKPAAFYTVGIAGLAVFACVWLSPGSHARQLHEQLALVEGLRRAGVGEHAKVYWGSSVPDGRVTFYGNRWIHQLGDPYALRAEADTSEPMTLLLEMASKICTMLEGERVYFVFTRDRFGLLKWLARPKATVLFEVDRDPPGRDEDDWVVVTNASEPASPQTASSPASPPASRPATSSPASQLAP